MISAHTPTANSIIKASARLFAVNGYDIVTTRQIASAVGIKASSIYNHFSSKDDILKEIIEYFCSNIDKYYLELEEFMPLIASNDIYQIVDKLNIVYNKYEYELMLYATAIIIRERFNFDYVNDCFYIYFIDKPIKYVASVLDKMVEHKMIKPCNTKQISTLWQAGSNELAFKVVDILKHHSIDDVMESARIGSQTYGFNNLNQVRIDMLSK